MAISDAVTLERISRIIGYKLSKGFFNTVSPNLPQRIAVLGEANYANQGTLDTTPTAYTDASSVGAAYGYGSPMHIMARILFPFQGGGVGGVPVVFYPQVQAVGAASKKLNVIPTGVATGNGTHTLVIAGREGIDGEFYDINILNGDVASDISQKMVDAVNAILGAPMIGTDYDYEAQFESKWRGQTADELNITVNTNGDDLGITYTVTSPQNASGTPSVTAALTSFGANWNTIVVNSYGIHAGTMTALEAFNGRPDPENPTGRFVGIIMKPIIAITGNCDDDISATTDARPLDVTIAIAPAPGSAGLPMEAAANMTVLQSNNAQNTPHLDVSGRNYPDMPTPTSIGSMADYNNRDAFVKKGLSTVDLVAGQYVVQDFVTTYHKAGENPPQYRYVRNLNIDYNVRYGYYLLEQINVVDHVIAADEDIVNASKVIKPKMWKAIVADYAADLANRGLIVNAAFMQESILVALSQTNPDRLETSFNYKRSGFVRISSTTAFAGFNFGAVN